MGIIYQLLLFSDIIKGKKISVKSVQTEVVILSSGMAK